jgi:hypothetical protein
VVTVGSSSGTAAENVRGKVVDFFTVFVSDDRATSGTGVSSEGNSILFTYFWLRGTILSLPCRSGHR